MGTSNQEIEFKGKVINGFMLLLLLLAVDVAGAWVMWVLLRDCGSPSGWWFLGGVVALVINILGLSGLFVQQPNIARNMMFFGKYVGTFRGVGFFFVNPFLTLTRISLRIWNMDAEPIKVNDKVGNPVLIGMVLVWRVRDAYKVQFDLEGSNIERSLEHFVRVQSDAALREVTGRFAYDNTESNDPQELTLRDGGEEINDMLERKLNDRLAMAGIEVMEARINYLAYAPEIAAVMLRRQQASAVVTAREKIVEGAVSMVDIALQQLEERHIVHLKDEQKASLVSNLLVVLCSDEGASPVVNAGS